MDDGESRLEIHTHDAAGRQLPAEFMVSMCPNDRDSPPTNNPIMSRLEVHTCIDVIARDIMLLANQIPCVVLEAPMRPRLGVPVDRFLTLMASTFDIGNVNDGATPRFILILYQITEPS
ncbi:hypothetical protein HU200_044021 [Digitaria exilis]|uniref:Uncharacterized protein n=1 Tax=Digitaria exilis TaxID=1010633 RepID=A0A835B810_9POAL|nr:hypothetical protein HU200_044021 [Digitaria exilis]